MAVVGFIFACIPGAFLIGWILLPVSFVLGIVGVALSGKKKGTSIAAIIVAVIGTIVGIIVFLAVISSAVDDAFSDDDLTAEDSAPTEVEEPPESSQDDEGTATDESDGELQSEESSGAEGTRDDPFQVGDAVSSADWTVSLGAPYEANDVVAAENELNDPPEDGKEFWIIPVDATYTGADSGMPLFDIDINFVGDDGNTYNTFSPGCGVIPDALVDADELSPDATAVGNVCVPLPDGAPGLWSVAVDYGEPVFFSAD